MKVARLRELNTEKIGPNGSEFVCSASGIVKVGELLYVVPDDELMLAVFKVGSQAPGIWLRLFDGDLPRDHAERKQVKPDLESLTFIPPHRWAENGALLAVPSGSKSHRQTGAMLPLGKFALESVNVIPVNFEPLYKRLSKDIPQLNIEGVVFLKDRCLLLNRGDGGRGRNVVIFLDSEKMLAQLHYTHVLSEDLIDSAVTLELGDLDGVRLAFTDACALPDGRVLYLAAAEDTDDPCEDGLCKGSVMGIMSGSGKLESSQRIEYEGKIEGVFAWQNGGSVELLMVTDADSDKMPSVLLSASLKMG